MSGPAVPFTVIDVVSQPRTAALALSRPPETVLPEKLGSDVTVASSSDLRAEVVNDGHFESTSAAPPDTNAADIEVPDLRGGFSHLIAALAAKGQSTVRGIGLIDRGYENFQDKLLALGADVTRG